MASILCLLDIILYSDFSFTDMNMSEKDWDIIAKESNKALNNCTYTSNLIKEIENNLERIVRIENKIDVFNDEYCKFLIEMLECLLDRDIESVRLNDQILEYLERYH